MTGPQALARPSAGHQPWTIGAAAAVGILFFVFLINSYCNEIFALATPAIARDWAVAPKVFAGSMAAGWLGSGIGSLIGGVMGDKIGRYKTIILVSLVAALATIASAVASGPAQMLATRAIAGVGLGAAVPPALALIAECVPDSRRGFVISLAMICGPAGIAAVAMVGGLVMPSFGWKVFLISGGLACLAITVAFAVIGVESPAYLMRLSNSSKALARSLRRLGAAAAPETIPVAGTAPQPSSGGVSPWLILSPAFGGTTVRICLCFIAIFVSVSALLSWAPTTLSAASFSAAETGNAISAWSLGGVAGTLLSGWCMSRWGARVASQVFAAASAIAVGLLVVFVPDPHQDRLLLLIPMAVAGLALSALVTSLYGFVAEYYPAPLRSTGVGLAAMIGRSSAVAGSYGGIYLFEASGMRGFFAGIALLALLPLVLLLSRRRAAEVPAAMAEVGEG